jgi:hypothetical protein
MMVVWGWRCECYVRKGLALEFGQHQVSWRRRGTFRNVNVPFAQTMRT